MNGKRSSGEDRLPLVQLEEIIRRKAGPFGNRRDGGVGPEEVGDPNLSLRISKVEADEQLRSGVINLLAIALEDPKEIPLLETGATAGIDPNPAILDGEDARAPFIFDRFLEDGAGQLIRCLLERLYPGQRLLRPGAGLRPLGRQEAERVAGDPLPDLALQHDLGLHLASSIPVTIDTGLIEEDHELGSQIPFQQRRYLLRVGGRW